MSNRAQAFEAYLARLYTDPGERARFLLDPAAAASAAGLDSAAARALAAIDRPGLELAARSFAAKRDVRARARQLTGGRLHTRVLSWFRRLGRD